MDNCLEHTVAGKAISGRRRAAPRVCVVDSKPHLVAFLSETLQELGFIARQCRSIGELETALAEALPDVVLLLVSPGGINPATFLKTLVHAAFGGKVLTVGARESMVVEAIPYAGEEYGLAMLPPLTIPFTAKTLLNRLAPPLSAEQAPRRDVDVSAALRAGWVELWYQPKMDAHALTCCGAEALVRIRHPIWGVISPASFVPAYSDPHFHNLSEFVIDRALEDWQHFLEQGYPLDISINLPAALLKESQSLRGLCRRMQAHPEFHRLTIEVNCDEALEERCAPFWRIAHDLGLHNISLSIDNVSHDWLALKKIDRFPFSEIKVDGHFVTGCGRDRPKRTVCGQIVELAKEHNVRTVAVGVTSRADQIAAHEIGFDLVQGDRFGKPMPLRAFVRSVLTSQATPKLD